MISEDQGATRMFLAAAMARDGAPVATRDTHISHLVLGRDRVWKLKRAVRLPYLDFSTPARRLAACGREVELNRRTAPRHYLGVRRITREAAGLALDGPGPLVDAVVEMRRFDENCLLDRLADRGALSPAIVEALAGEVAALHVASAPETARTGSAHVADVLAVNEAAFAETAVIAPEDSSCLGARFRDAVARHRALLDARGRAGRVRRAHGDLHLRNVFVEAGRPVLFDCIEFSESLATVDVLYDLAFLLMDLVHRGLDGLANLAMNRYLDRTGDEGGLPLLPLFMALRAAVRAHVAAAAVDAGDAARRPEAKAYFARARDLLEPRPGALVAIGGLSGSGKSTVAAAIAPRLGGGAGARILSSDRLRKAMHGVGPETRLPPSAYTPEISAAVYGALATRAGALAARGGVAVIADAVFASDAERARIAAAARAAGVPFRGVWLAADAATLRARVAARRGGPSDADVAVLERQLSWDLGRIDWPRFDATAGPEAIAAAVTENLPGPLEASACLTAGRRCG